MNSKNSNQFTYTVTRDKKKIEPENESKIVETIATGRSNTEFVSKTIHASGSTSNNAKIKNGADISCRVTRSKRLLSNDFNSENGNCS